jgi:hypothetical protein
VEKQQPKLWDLSAAEFEASLANRVQEFDQRRTRKNIQRVKDLRMGTLSHLNTKHLPREKSMDHQEHLPKTRLKVKNKNTFLALTNLISHDTQTSLVTVLDSSGHSEIQPEFEKTGKCGLSSIEHIKQLQKAAIRHIAQLKVSY